MPTKMKFLLKLIVLCSFVLLTYSCDKSALPPEKREVRQKIMIGKNIYPYTCNYTCVRCELTNIKGQSKDTLKELSERFQSIINKQCENDRGNIYWLVDPQFSSCTYKSRWDWWTLEIDWSDTRCYERNRWGDTLAILDLNSRRVCAHYFHPVQLIADACSGTEWKDWVEEGNFNMIIGVVGGDVDVDGGCGSGRYFENDFSAFNQDWVGFRPANSNYGFDSWFYLDTNSLAEAHLHEEKTNYASLRNKSSKHIGIGVNYSTALYDHFEARIVNGGTSSLSFCKNYIDTVFQLKSGKIRMIQIFGHNEGTAEIEVWAVNTEQKGKEIRISKTNNRTVDRLVVKVYEEHNFGELNIYRVGDAKVVNQGSTWERHFNNVLKQMVARVGAVNVKSSQDGWDQNGNGRFDLIEGLGVTDSSEARFNRNYSANRRWVAEGKLLAVENGVYQRVMNNEEHAHFIVPGQIREHRVVTRDYIRADDRYSILYLSNADIDERAIYTISKYYDPSDIGERIRLRKTGQHNNAGTEHAVTFQKVNADGTVAGLLLDNDYFKNDNITVYIDGPTAGFAFASLSIIEDINDYNAHLHEFLHHGRSKSYPHVQRYEQQLYSRNLMGTTLPIGNELRYRKLKIHGKNERYSQWERIRGN